MVKARRKAGVHPWRSQSSTSSTDPEPVGKVIDFVQLYPAPPENADVGSIDETSQVQALHRTAVALHTKPGPPERHTASYVRNNSTITLFVALNIATGRVSGLCQPWHRNQELPEFLSRAARADPTTELHE